MDNNTKVLTLGFVNGKEISTRLTEEKAIEIQQAIEEESALAGDTMKSVYFINIGGINVNIISLAYYLIINYVPNEKLN